LLSRFVKRGGTEAVPPTLVGQEFFTQLIEKTENFGHLTWLGKPIWQNLLDLWTIQETIYEIRPALLIESGTNRGGSSYFFASLFDLMGHGRVITIDVEKLHDLSRPRVTYLLGGSVAPEIVE
jgi:cephalosporin hydroxylase